MKQNKYYRVKRVVDNEYYILESCDGNIVTQQIKDIDKSASVFTIADAKDGDIIGFNDLIRNDDSYIDWVGIYKQAIGTNRHLFHCVITGKNNTFRAEGSWRVLTAYPATKEQRTLFFKKMQEVGYEWDADKKELKKIQPHYDISNFKPFDKVLTRDSDNGRWSCRWFSRYDKNQFLSFITTNSVYSQCIPFEGNEHLLGTTDMPSEEYINW